MASFTEEKLKGYALIQRFQPVTDMTGLVFAFTGALTNTTREDAKTLITSRGGIFSDTVTQGVDYLIIGNKPGATKLRAGGKYRTHYMLEQTFLNSLALCTPQSKEYHKLTKNKEQMRTQLRAQMNAAVPAPNQNFYSLDFGKTEKSVFQKLSEGHFINETATDNTDDIIRPKKRKVDLD